MVKHFTPTEEDVANATSLMNKVIEYRKHNPILRAIGDMTVLDFEHLFTEEQKEVQRKFVTQNTPSQFKNNFPTKF